MDTVKKLEETVASWYKGMPHLPEKGRTWLAQNVWWITLVGVIFAVMAACSLLFFTLIAGILLGSYGGPAGVALGGLAVMAAFVALAFLIVYIVLAGMAITPLRALQKKGWTLLFILMLLAVLSHAVGFLMTFNMGELVARLLFAAIGAYFLFEIRDHFGAKKEVKEKAKPEATA